MKQKQRRSPATEYKGYTDDKWKQHAVKTSFYLPRQLMDRFRDIAWYKRKPGSRIVRKLIEDYVNANKRVPKRSQEDE